MCVLDNAYICMCLISICIVYDRAYVCKYTFVYDTSSVYVYGKASECMESMYVYGNASICVWIWL